MSMTRSKTKSLALRVITQDISTSSMNKMRKRKIPESNEINKNKIKTSKSSKKDEKVQNNKINNSIGSLNKENQTEEDSLNLEYEKQVYHLQKVLSTKFVDVNNRLKLDFTPNCLRDMLFCKQNHSKSCPAPPVISQNTTYKLNHFLTEKRPLNFLKICYSMMQQGTLLNEDILNSIFQLLITNQSNDEDNYTSDYIVNESKMTLIHFINIFPPCWKKIRKVYMNFCTASVDSSKFFPNSNNIVEQRNMFLFLIYMIEEIVSEIEDRTSLCNNNSTESEIIFNFKEWETKNSNNNNLNALNRKEKLNRLFLCLDIFVKIFEVDLSLWILRYLSRPYKHLFTEDMPLIIASLLIKESTPISDYVRKIMNLYTVLILNNYSNLQTNIFQRLLSLLSVVMNLMDAENDETKYPIIKIKTINFARELYEIFDGTCGMSFSGFLNVVENIKIPYIRLFVISQFLRKLDKETTNDDHLTPKTIYERLSKLYWRQYKKAAYKISIINGKLQQKFDNSDEESPRFPTIEKNIYKNTVLEIYREEYLYMHLEALRSYCDAFFTKDFLLILMDCYSSSSSIILSTEIDKESKINKKINLEKLEKDASKMLPKIDLKASFEKSNVYELPEYDGVRVNSDIILNYRSDFKYLSLMKNKLPFMIEKFGKEFDVFTEFIEFCFSPQ